MILYFENLAVNFVFPFINDSDYDTDASLLGYTDEEKRKRVLELIKRTIDYGMRLGAKGVVIQPGEVPVKRDSNYDKMLKNLYMKNRKDIYEYRHLNLLSRFTTAEYSFQVKTTRNHSLLHSINHIIKHTD